MAKSYDEQMAEALKSVQRAQARVAALKDKKKKEDERKIKKIGNAIVKCFPELLDLMDNKEFDIDEFVKSANFSRAFHFRFVQPDDRKIPSWTKTKMDEEKEENQIETEEPKPELVSETEEVEETNTENISSQHQGYFQYI